MKPETPAALQMTHPTDTTAALGKLMQMADFYAQANARAAQWNGEQPNRDKRRAALERALRKALASSSAPAAVVPVGVRPPCPQEVTDAITAYGDARADQENGAATTSHLRLNECIHAIRDALQDVAATPAQPVAAPSAPVQPKPLDDPRLQQAFGDAIEGALAFGYQGTNKPPEGHWLWRFWNLGRNQAALATPQPAAQEAPREAVSDAARDVLAERRRQVEAEGWTPEHDDEHADGSMARAAAVYALYDLGVPASQWVDSLRLGNGDSLWPWDWQWLKPKDHRRNLVRAGALILAEIERLDRAASTVGREEQR